MCAMKFRSLPFSRRSENEMRERACALRDELQKRRSVREFSADPIPLDVVRQCIASASTAPSGANKQPWTFALVTDPAVKAKIKEAAEEEERDFYERRASEEWLRDLDPFGTGPSKPFLKTAPALIVVFAQRTGLAAEGEEPARHYYVNESVGIAVGFLLAALHHAGFATLTHTPSPMRFLASLLDRPKNERAFMLIPIGYPADDCAVPNIEKKALDEVLVEY